MTKEKQELIDRFNQLIETNPNKSILAAQCATIAKQYHSKQLALCSVSKPIELLNSFVREWNKEVSKDNEMYCIDDEFVNEFTNR